MKKSQKDAVQEYYQRKIDRADKRRAAVKTFFCETLPIILFITLAVACLSLFGWASFNAANKQLEQKIDRRIERAIDQLRPRIMDVEARAGAASRNDVNIWNELLAQAGRLQKLEKPTTQSPIYWNELWPCITNTVLTNWGSAITITNDCRMGTNTTWIYTNAASLNQIKIHDPPGKIILHNPHNGQSCKIDLGDCLVWETAEFKLFQY